MSFIEFLEKIKIKTLAPSTVCYRNLGHFQSELKYFSWLPCFLVFKDEPIDDDGYYKTVYINNKRVKRWYIIPRNALIEVREQPKDPISTILGTIGAAVLSAVGISVEATATAAIIAGIATVVTVGAALVGIGVAISGALGKKSANNSGTKTYSSNDAPYLSGAKNELLEKIVPIAFGRIKQTFNYGQYNTPLVKSGYSGNRYRVYSVSGYQNARYSDFKLGDVLLSDYRSSAYVLQQSHGTNTFIGWDNSCTENFNNKELSFDNTQTISQSAIIYHNKVVTGTSLSITQKYHFTGVPTSSKNWTNKKMNIVSTFISDGEELTAEANIEIKYADLVSDGQGGHNAEYTVTVDLEGATINEYSYTTITPNGVTRGSNESNLLIDITEETINIGGTTDTTTETQGVNSYSGDKNEIISQSQRDTKYCDIHFSFPQGLYKMSSSSASRVRVTIKAVIEWKREGETSWRSVEDENISRIYTRNIDGVVEDLSSRITRSGDTFTFKTPANINDADSIFFENVGLEFAEAGQYLVRITPVAFNKSNYWVGTINISDIVWRLDESIPVLDNSILPHVSQIRCTFNATTQLDGEVDELNAICEPLIKNIETGNIEKSRNPVDIIYYLLTDTHSNPKPMKEEQIDIDSFKKARQWCEQHNYKCDGIVSDEVKYESIISEICSNHQLYLIPNKWGKVVLRVDTNEDGRPVKTFFTAENSWDLQVTRLRGRLGRTLAIRASYTDEETWSEQEITGYWYDNACHFEPQAGLGDEYYQPEKKEFKYLVDVDCVKRRIAYELEIANVKNVKASFKVAREVLDLEVLDRVYVADYTRIDDGISGSIQDLILGENGDVIGVKINAPVKVTNGMTMTIRSVDLTGQGNNVNIYSLVENDKETSDIMFTTPIAGDSCIIRKAGFYNIDGQEFYHSGDLFMVGTAEILSMVISEIEEISGDDFTSKITCRLY